MSEHGVPVRHEASWQTYSDLKDKLVALVVGLKGVQDGGELGGVELDYGARVSTEPESRGDDSEGRPGRCLHTVDDGTDNLEAIRVSVVVT